jgi:O-acetylhomoserine/O-acetylserine sulfhydrylase-like pyridoxal-dependent enzyme
MSMEHWIGLGILSLKKEVLNTVKIEIDIPFVDKQKFIDCFKKAINKHTKVIFLSHITSATALIFPG